MTVDRRVEFVPADPKDSAGRSGEIVIHRRDMDAYGDYTLTPKGKGYEAIDAGIHGAFA